MKSKLKRIFSAFLSMTVLTCTLPASVITTSAEENSQYQCDAQNITDIQDGVILHCFDWKYTDIIDELPNIAAAGFKSVQTSPAQPGGGIDSSVWYWLYQPLGFYVGSNDLGTKEELQQLCTEAEKYGIKIIVDVVSNHLSGDHTYIQNDLKDSSYWRTSSNYSGRNAEIYNSIGMPDIKSENEYVYTAVKNYIQELKDIGVDGIRWDTAKHIQLPSDDNNCGCQFWDAVTSVEGMYHYGEILGLPNGDISIMKKYTQYMSVTDSNYGQEMRNGFNGGYIPSNSDFDQQILTSQGISADKLVYWGESHDTWSNNKGYGYSNEMPQNVIDKAYAIAASREGATALYFSRPEYRLKDNIKAGAKGSTHFTSPEVAAVNHFHNTMLGQADYYQKDRTTNVAAICRDYGAVIVKAEGGNANISLDKGYSTIVDGTYIDEITGNKWTVKNSKISGRIGDTGIAVLYNTTQYPNITALASSGSQTDTYTTLYFDNNRYNWSNISVYVYNELNSFQNNGEWPGQTMILDNTTGLYKLENVNTYNGRARVIFSGFNSENTREQYPSSGDKGMDCPADAGAMILHKVYCNNVDSAMDWRNIWDKYTPASAAEEGSVSVTANSSSFTDTLEVTLHANGVTNPIYMTSDGGYGSFTDGDKITIGNENTKTGALKVAVKGLKTDGTMASQIYTFTKIRENVSDTVLYFDLSKHTGWDSADARFAAYAFNSAEENEWFDMTAVDDVDHIYSVEIPSDTWNNIIFCRMDGTKPENSWDNKWGQTVDLTIPTDGKNRFVMNNNKVGGSGDDKDKYDGTWGTYTPAAHTHTYGEPVWTWADDCSSATASFPCLGCDEPFTATDSAPAVDYISNIRTHTATVTGPDGESYPSPVKYEPMVVQESPAGSVEYLLKNAELFRYLYQEVMNHNTAINIYSYSVPADQFETVTSVLSNCFPELFFISGSYGGSTSNNKIYTIKPSYNEDKTTADTKVAAFNAKANEYLSLLDNSMDDFTKALVLHDRLVLDHYYQIETETKYSSNYTFMIEGWGRCENYAEVYAYLLARAGIKSEIVDGNAGGAHEWIKICLNGEWYNIDITFDDPIVNGSDRLNKVSHKFFLVSDELIQDSSYNTTVHTGFTSKYATDTFYDGHDKLHSNENPFFYADDAFWTLYTKPDEDNSDFENGAFTPYDVNNDDYISDMLTIKDRWSAGSPSVYQKNYSSLAEYNGKLYINGEHKVYEFDPELSTYDEFITYDSPQLYGIYVKDNILYGLSADTLENDNTPTPVVLYTFGSNKYTVRWVNYDGTELEKDENVAFGTTPEYNGATPARPGNAQYTYTFAGWTPEISDVTENVTYTATYSETLNEYTVTWKDDDSNVLKTEQIPYGTTPSYGGTPTKANTLQYSYTFADWTPEITAVTGNAEYKANFTAVPAEIWTITAYNFAGWENVSLYYWNSTGENAAWPGEQLTASDNFTFTATIPSTVEGIIFNDGTENGAKTANITSGIANNAEWGVGTKDGSVTCNIAKYYLVGTMNNWDINGALEFSPNKNDTHTEEFILTTQLNQGDRFKAKSSDGRWFPYGADKGITINRTGTYNIYVRPNADGFAEWNNYVLYAEAVTHCVNFDSGVDSQTIYHNETATEPEAPVKYGYTFDGWYLVDTLYDFNTPVTEDITLTAHWTEKTVNIQFKGFNGKDKTTLEIFAVNGSFSDESIKSQIRANIPSASYIDGYQLVGWTLNNTKYGIDEQENLITALAGLVAEISDDAIIINEVYEQKDEEYTVTVNNGKIKNGGTTGTFKPSDQVYVTATGGAEGQKFSYWTKQDEDSVSPVKVGYETTYAFRMPSKDTTLSAVFQDKPEEKVGTAYIENVTVHDGNKISFVSVVSVPDNATILRAGIVACKESDITAEYDNVPNIDIARFKRYNDTTCKNYKSFKYTWTKGNVDTNDIWCVRAYLLYQDAGGEEHNVYSPIVKADLVHNGIIPQDS